MSTGSQTAASDTSSRFEHVTPHDIFASLKSGGSVVVEEWPHGDLEAVARRVGGRRGVILIEVNNDGHPWTPDYTDNPLDSVSFHPDEGDRLALIARALDALDNAHQALLAAGYVDEETRMAARQS